MLRKQKKNKAFSNFKSDIIKKISDFRIKIKRKIDKSFGKVDFKGKVKKISSNSKISNFGIFKKLKSLNSRLLRLILFIFILAVFSLVNLIKLVGIHRTDLNPNSNNQIDTEEINISFAVYQEKDEYGDTFKYISSLNVVSIRPMEIKIVNIDPRFEVNRKKAFSVFVNNENENKQESVLISDYAEAVSRLRVDGSILLSYENFGSLMSNIGIISSLDQLESFKLLDEEGKVVFSKQKQALQLDILRKYFSGGFNFANKYFRYFWQFEDQINLIETDLGIDGLIKVINVLGNQKRTDTLGISSESANFIEDEAGNIRMVPLDALFKERYFESYKDLRVFTEQAELEVYNASTTTGLASQISGRLGSLGANIIRTGNYFDRIDQSTIFIKEDADAITFRETISAIRRNINSEVVINIGDYPLQMSGDIVLVLK